MIVINDLHLCPQRTGGTTLQSAAALKEHQRKTVEDFLKLHSSAHVVVNGDLLDSFEIETAEVVRIFEMFADWLKGSSSSLTFIMGNHDASAKAGKVSSFHLLSHFLSTMFPDRFRLIDHTHGFCKIEDKVWAISHCLNQDLFDVELEKAAKANGKGKYLLLHCNVKNTFADHSDHSLNLTNDALTSLMSSGWTLIVGHEHQGYSLRNGRIIVVGNQWPTSIIDCLGETTKHALQFNGSWAPIQTWKAEGSYAELNWRDLQQTEAKFIRVVGDATSEEAADVIAAVSQYRQKSNAFIVANAVKVEGVEALNEVSTEAIGSIKSFDVLGAIYELLDEKEIETVKSLVSDATVPIETTEEQHDATNT